MDGRAAMLATPAGIAPLFGALALMLSFALLSRRRSGAMIAITRWQTVVLALAAAWQAWARDTAPLYVLATLALAAALGAPLVLRFPLRERVGGTGEPPSRIAPTLALGAAIVLLATLVMVPLATPAREDMALALAIVLLGLLTTATRGAIPARAAGFASMLNGLLLAAIAAAGVPFAWTLPSAAPAVALLVAALPFAAALVLALVPSWRAGAGINAAAATLLFAATCALPWQPDAPSGALLRANPLAIHFVLLTSFVGMTTAWCGIGHARAAIALRRLDRRRLRHCHALFQLLLGGAMLALLSDNLALTWIGLTIAGLAAARAAGLARGPASAPAAAGAWQLLAACGVGSALALFGIIVLYLAAAGALGAGPAAPGLPAPGLPSMSWSAILTAAPRCNAPLLGIAFAFLLLGLGATAALAPMHAWLPAAQAEAPAPVAALLGAALLNTALFVVLRVRAILAADAGALTPGPPLMALGLLSLLVVAWGLRRRRDLRHCLALSTIGQTGVAAFAFGLGGAPASFAGLLHLTLHTLTRTSALQCAALAAPNRGEAAGGLLAAQRPLGLSLAACLLGLAAVPPFGLFASSFLVLTETARVVPVLLAPLGLGLLIGAVALIRALQLLCLGTAADRRSAPSAPWLSLAPVWLHLGIVVVLGLAMPASVLGWMRAAAGGMP